MRHHYNALDQLAETLTLELALQAIILVPSSGHGSFPQHVQLLGISMLNEFVHDDYDEFDVHLSSIPIIVVPLVWYRYLGSRWMILLHRVGTCQVIVDSVDTIMNDQDHRYLSVACV